MPAAASRRWVGLMVAGTLAAGAVAAVAVGAVSAAPAGAAPIPGVAPLGAGASPAISSRTAGAPLFHEVPGAVGPRRSSGAATRLGLVRVVSYLSMVVLCGGLAFLALAWPAGAEVTSARRLLWAAVLAGLAASAAGVWALRAALAAPGRGGLIANLVGPETVDSEVARLLVVRGLLFLLAVPAVAALAAAGRRAVRTPCWLVAAAAVGVGLLRTPGLVGHAQEGRLGWLGSVAALVHLLGVAIWLGGLVVLCAVVLPRRRAEELVGVVTRFSSLAAWAVGAVVAGGSFMSWQLVGGFHGLVATRYGHVLLVKLLAVAGILVAARFSKSWVDHRLDTAAAVVPGGAVTVRPFAVSVAVEASLALFALAAASVLVGTSPGR